MTNKDIESRMDRIIEWVKACDTKASIMLTIVGLLISFIFTSESVMRGLSSIIHSYFEYNPSTRSISDLSISGLLTLISLIVSVYFLLGSIYRFIVVLYSKPKETLSDSSKPSLIFRLFNILFCYERKDLNETDTFKDSLTHFNHISNLSYSEFKEQISSPNYQENEDLLSQVYINAKRCSEKFSDCNSAILWLLRALPCLIVFFLSLLIYVS